MKITKINGSLSKKHKNKMITFSTKKQPEMLCAAWCNSVPDKYKHTCMFYTILKVIANCQLSVRCAASESASVLTYQ